MPYYRAYLVDDNDSFVSFREVVSTDDVTAIEAAKRLVDSHAIELWEGGRIIIKLPKNWDDLN
jgi:hypothetical protein